MKFFYVIFFMACSDHVSAQQVPLTTQQQLELLAETQIMEGDDEQLLQQLEYFNRHPLQLNTASMEEMQALKLLTDVQIDYFLTYRKMVGKLIDLHELQAVPGWNAVLIQRILPYVTIKETVNVKENFKMRLQGEHLLLFRASRILEKSKGFEKFAGKTYLGDRQHLLMRYRYQFKDLLFAGFTGEKDAGEQFFRGAQSKGFDFYSFHILLQKMGFLKTLALGDFMVNLGQGLISWQSTGFGKSAEVMAVKRSSPVILPYRAGGETGFYRGVGVTVGGKRLQVTFLVSRKRISGAVDDSAGFFSAIQVSGYHRTIAEMAQKNRISQVSVGGKVAFKTDRFHVGLNTLYHHFSLPMVTKTLPYQRYEFSGKNLMHMSIDLQYTIKNIHLFGEVAADQKKHLALVGGALISADPSVDLSLLYRSLPKDFLSIFGNAFSENTIPFNEKGLYFGIAFRPTPSWIINAYSDIFYFPWLRFRVNLPSRGYDYLVQASYHPNKQVELYLRYKNKNKPLHTLDYGVMNPAVPAIKQNLRFQLNNQLLPDLVLKTRIEIVWYDSGREKIEQGFLGFAELNFQPLVRLQAGVRLQYFETASYSSRIYAYEPDVMYGFSIPAFYNKGARYLVNLQWNISNQISIWARWAQMLYQDLDHIGDGADLIKGTHKSEVKLQCRILF